MREAYEKSLQRDSHDRDAAQEAVVAELEQLQQRLLDNATRKRGLLDLFRPRNSSADEGTPGLYIWGGVGRGKTFLMDLFFETLSIDAKKRIHFHRMLHEVHERLARLVDVADPLDQVADDIADDTRVLCFDEATGQPVWTHSYSVDYKNMEYGNGPRASPTVHEGKVYTLGTQGHLFCLDAVSGRVLWQKDLAQEYDARVPQYGASVAPLVEGDLLIEYVTPVAQASAVILDIDCRTNGGPPCEQWTITAYDTAGAVLDSVVLAAPEGGPNPECQSPGAGPGDSEAFGWAFSFGSPQIKSIVLRYTGTAPIVGLGFDNFSLSSLQQPLDVTASSPADTICAGDVLTLSAFPTGGRPPYTFQWQQEVSPSIWFDLDTGTTQEVQPVTTASYRMTVTDADASEASSALPRLAESP